MISATVCKDSPINTPIFAVDKSFKVFFCWKYFCWILNRINKCIFNAQEVTFYLSSRFLKYLTSIPFSGEMLFCFLAVHFDLGIIADSISVLSLGKNILKRDGRLLNLSVVGA